MVPYTNLDRPCPHRPCVPIAIALVADKNVLNQSVCWRHPDANQYLSIQRVAPYDTIVAPPIKHGLPKFINQKVSINIIYDLNRGRKGVEV